MEPQRASTTGRRTPAILAPVLVIVALSLGLLGGWFLPKWLIPGFGPGKVTLSTTTVLTQVQGLSQLVTIKYVMEKVVVLEDVKVYGESRVLLIAHGVVKAGIDLSKMKPEDIKISGTKARVTLPMPAITDAYLDEQKTQVLEHSTGLLRRFDKDLQQSARAKGLDEIRRAARYNGILEEAEERARQQLTFMLHQLGVQDVEFHH